MLLEARGHEVHAVDDESAISAIERLRPHVALLDIGMPGASSYGGQRSASRAGDAR
jgi:CheY-like chemotaxis protein